MRLPRRSKGGNKAASGSCMALASSDEPQRGIPGLGMMRVLEPWELPLAVG